ncbi:MAG: hypothetical protein IJ194_07245 [Bacilli bacterium]|nr:hypothetical protein [Bacilli bacterium]
MNELRRQEQLARDRQEKNQLINQFNQIDNKLENAIGQCKTKAKDALLKHNDVEGFKMFAKSMKYYQGLRFNITKIRNQFENFWIQAEIASTFIGLKGVLKKTANMMDSMPSLKRNSKDFLKFKRSLLKGQISMDSINNMMADLDPSTDTSMSEEEFDSLKKEFLLSSNMATGSNTLNANDTNTVSANDDFFAEIKD